MIISTWVLSLVLSRLCFLEESYVLSCWVKWSHLFLSVSEVLLVWCLNYGGRALQKTIFCSYKWLIIRHGFSLDYVFSRKVMFFVGGLASVNSPVLVCFWSITCMVFEIVATAYMLRSYLLRHWTRESSVLFCRVCTYFLVFFFLICESLSMGFKDLSLALFDFILLWLQSVQ